MWSVERKDVIRITMIGRAAVGIRYVCGSARMAGVDTNG
jgi:hypothetical protein